MSRRASASRRSRRSRRPNDKGLECDIDVERPTYFLSRTTIRVTDAPGMRRWRKRLFALSHNAANEPIALRQLADLKEPERPERPMGRFDSMLIGLRGQRQLRFCRYFGAEYGRDSIRGHHDRFVCRRINALVHFHLQLENPAANPLAGGRRDLGRWDAHRAGDRVEEHVAVGEDLDEGVGAVAGEPR